MKGDIEVRSVLIAEYLIKTSATVRQAAKEFGVGKQPYIQTSQSGSLNSISLWRTRHIPYWRRMVPKGISVAGLLLEIIMQPQKKGVEIHV